MRLVFASLLWHFDIEPVERNKDWIAEQSVGLTWGKAELTVRLKPRDWDLEPKE